MIAPKEKAPSGQGKGLTGNDHGTILSLELQKIKRDKSALIGLLGAAGHVVQEHQGQSFTVVNPRWGMSRYLPDLAALQNFARIVGVHHAQRT